MPAGTVDVPDMKDGYALRIGVSGVLFDTGSSCSDSGESGEGSLGGQFLVRENVVTLLRSYVLVPAL